MANKIQNNIRQFMSAPHRDEQDAWLVTLIQWIILAALMVPVITIPSLLNPYTFSKTIFYYALIQIAVGLYGVLVVRNPNYAPWVSWKSEQGTVRRNWILLVALAHFAILVLATLFAYDRSVSFFGNIDWTSGLLTYLHLFALMIVMLSVFREKASWRWVLRIVVIVATVGAIWALVQWLKGIEARSFFGNRGYLAGFLLFGVFQSLALLWNPEQSEDEEESKWFIYAALAIQVTVILFVTDVRGGVIGLLGGGLAMVIAYLLAHERKKVRTATAAVSGILLVGAVLAGTYLLSSGKLVTLFERAATVKTRLFTWKVGLEAVKDRPLFGYGLENYGVAFDQKFDPSYYAGQAEQGVAFEFSAAQPHNKVIEVAATSGLLGVGTYLALYGVMLWALFDRFRNTQDKSLLALIGLWVAHLGHTFFLFDTITTYVLFFVTVAYTAVAVYDPKPADASSRPVPKQLVWGVSVTMAVLVLLGINYAVILPVRANYQGGLAIRSLQKGEFQLMLEHLDAQARLGQFNIAERTIVGSADNVQTALVKQKEFSDFHKETLKKVIRFNEQIVAREPYVSYSRLGLGGLYNVAGKHIDPSYYEKNIAFQTESIKRSPGRLDLYYNIAESYFGLGETEKGIAAMQQAIDLAPDYGYSYYVFALAYGNLNQPQQAIDYLEQAMARGLNDGPIMNTYLEYTHKARMYDKAVTAAKRLVQLNPKDPQQLANLAMLYYETKDWTNAKDTLNQLIQKYPNQKDQAEKLLKQIPN